MHKKSPHFPPINHLIRTLIHRQFSTATNNLTKAISLKHKCVATEVLTEYLHSTRALPYTFAELISKNSANSLSQLLSEVPCHKYRFKKSFQVFLRYHPINEFSFFYESIGIDFDRISCVLSPDLYFLSDDCVFENACCLAGFGFPWGMLGRLYVDKVSIFAAGDGVLKGRLDGLVGFGFDNQQVVGICLAFPGLLIEGEVGFDGLLDDLKRVFLGFDLGSCLVGNVDVWFEVCRKIKVFYELGVVKGEFGKLIGEGKRFFTDYSEADLVEKVEFFSKLGVEKSEVGFFILSNPDLLSIKLKDRMISVSSILAHFGLSEVRLLSVKQNYKYVLGRNKMVNLPCILRAMDLHKWFFDRMKCGYHKLFANYDLSSPDDGVYENYVQKMEIVKTQRTCSYSFSKLEFFHGIGFGENGFTMRLLVDARATPSDLQERFNLLLNEGIEFSKLCKMIIRAPKIFNQKVDSIKKKLDFFKEIGLPLDDLETFPAYLRYNLEKHIQPRYRFHVWLIEQGWCTNKYSLGTIIDASHKGFLSRLSRVHSNAPKVWLEQYGNK